MKKFIVPLLVAVTAIFGFREVKNTVTRSAITFQTKNMGIGVDGTIGGLQADMHFNPADPATSTIEASVDVNTLNTDNSSRDDHLKSGDFFDIARYPKITLKLISFKHKSGSNYTGRFNLTIKAKNKQIDIPFTYVEKDNTVVVKSTFKINRLDYGIGGSSLVLADEVTVNVDAECSK